MTACASICEHSGPAEGKVASEFATTRIYWLLPEQHVRVQAGAELGRSQLQDDARSDQVALPAQGQGALDAGADVHARSDRHAQACAAVQGGVGPADRRGSAA